MDIPIYLFTGCLGVIREKLSSCYRDQMAHKAENIYTENVADPHGVHTATIIHHSECVCVFVGGGLVLERPLNVSLEDETGPGENDTRHVE